MEKTLNDLYQCTWRGKYGNFLAKIYLKLVAKAVDCPKATFT